MERNISRGIGAKSYLDDGLFADNGIEVIWYDYRTPEYEQLHGDYIDDLSVLDYLMMHENKYRPDGSNIFLNNAETIISHR